MKVVEQFVSINGEGMRAGELAVFVRFQGCNLNCDYCDTSWANEPDCPYTERTPEEIARSVRKTGVRNVTLTGGEPLLQPQIRELLALLSGNAESSPTMPGQESSEAGGQQNRNAERSPEIVEMPGHEPSEAGGQRNRNAERSPEIMGMPGHEPSEEGGQRNRNAERSPEIVGMPGHELSEEGGQRNRNAERSPEIVGMPGHEPSEAGGQRNRNAERSPEIVEIPGQESSEAGGQQSGKAGCSGKTVEDCSSDACPDRKKLSVEVETNGAVDLSPFTGACRPIFTMDYKLPGSGSEAAMCLSNFALLGPDDTVKFVVQSRKDLDRARAVIGEHELLSRCNVILSPVFGRIEPAEIVDYMERHVMNGVRLQLQLHKFIWDPEQRGV